MWMGGGGGGAAGAGWGGFWAKPAAATAVARIAKAIRRIIVDWLSYEQLRTQTARVADGWQLLLVDRHDRARRDDLRDEQQRRDAVQQSETPAQRMFAR